MAVQLTNNASSVLPGDVTSTDTTLTLAAGEGAKFPVLGTGDYFYLTLTDVRNNFEIVKVTARVGDTLTVERGASGTIPIPFPPFSRAELRVTVENVFIAVGDYLML